MPGPRIRKPYVGAHADDGNRNHPRLRRLLLDLLEDPPDDWLPPWPAT